MEYKVTVIVPVYNAQKYLSRCVDSILSQTYHDIEVILVDDGSTDSSAQMCDDFAHRDNRVKVIHKENAGAGMARNTAFEHTTGEYILFVDSDDYIEKDTIKKCVDSINEHGSDTVVFGHTFVYANGKTQTHQVHSNKMRYDEDSIKSDLLPSFFTFSKGFDVSVWGKLFSTQIIKDNELWFLSEREYYSEDSLFLLQYFPKSKSTSVVDENLYYYFENTSSLSREYEQERQDKLDIFKNKALDIAKKENITEMVKPHILVKYQLCAVIEYKQIASSDMTFAQKVLKIREYSSTDAIKSTLRKDVISKHSFAMRLFYTCIANRMYRFSYILLWIRLHK